MNNDTDLLQLEEQIFEIIQDLYYFYYRNNKEKYKLCLNVLEILTLDYYEQSNLSCVPTKVMIDLYSKLWEFK
jgi:hypothetical protein